MRKDDVERLRTSQALAVLNLPEFAGDREKILATLLKRDHALEAIIFRKIHQEAGCTTTSEFVYSKPSGFMEVDFFTEVKANYFVRKCPVHNVESREFFEIGSAPDDWDGISTSRRMKKD